MSRPFESSDLARFGVDPPALPGGFYPLLREVFSRHADQVALEAVGGGSWSYAELASTVEDCRRSLGARGVAAGDRVLAYVEKSLANVFLYLACLSHGAVYIPANPDYTSAELGDLITDARPRVVVCDPARASAPVPHTGPASLVSLQPDGTITGQAGLAQAEDPATVRPPAGDDPAVILYTSGTTGRPRGAVLTHRALAANALALCRAWYFRPDDTLIHALPLFHTHGLLVALHCALLTGSAMILMPGFDAGRAIGLFGRATVFMGVPTYYTRLLEHPALSRPSAGGMRLFTCGSAPLAPRVWEEFHRRGGHRIVERYGMTEVGILTSNPFEGERVPGSVGFPLEGVEIKVVDETGEQVAPGVTGELLAKSPGAFTGYLNRPAETAAMVSPDGWVATGDLAHLDGDGRVRLAGRSKDLIITGGLNVHPLQVESALDSLPGVAESAVFGVPHPDFGEGVVAAVVRRGAEEPSAGSLRRRLSSRLAGYKIPKRFLIVDCLPRNAMGKVQKNVLRSRYAGLFS